MMDGTLKELLPTDEMTMLAAAVLLLGATEMEEPGVMMAALRTSELTQRRFPGVVRRLHETMYGAASWAASVANAERRQAGVSDPPV